MRSARVGCLLLALAAAGCAGKTAAPDPNGAAVTARAYLDSLAHRDWPAAYDVLDGPSQGAVTREQFARRAENYYRSLGFEPERANVQSCQERGDQALAHVNFVGQAGSSTRYFKDGFALRREPAGWRVVLRLNFGMPSARR